MRCKSVYYDWIRTLPVARAFQEQNPGSLLILRDSRC